MIQLISQSTQLRGYQNKNNLIINFYNNIKSLDEFEINLIDMTFDSFWNFDNWNEQKRYKLDLISLVQMIINSKKTTIVYLLPKNIIRILKSANSNEYSELKDEISGVNKILQTVPEIGVLKFENTSTILGQKRYESAFYFNNTIGKQILTKSVISEKPTTIKCERVIATTLQMENSLYLENFIEEIIFSKNKSSMPRWVNDYSMFGDNELRNIVEENNKIITGLQGKIKDASNLLDRNNMYKSILYTNGDELVRVVFNILQEMLKCDLTKFEDKNKEDFLFEINEFVLLERLKA